MGACSLSWLCRLIDCSLLTQTDVKVPAFLSLSLSTLCCTVASIRSRLVQILHEGPTPSATTHLGHVLSGLLTDPTNCIALHRFHPPNLCAFEIKSWLMPA